MSVQVLMRRQISSNKAGSGTLLGNLIESSLREFSIFNIRVFLRTGNTCKRRCLIIHQSSFQSLIIDLQKAFIKRASGESESR